MDSEDDDPPLDPQGGDDPSQPAPVRGAGPIVPDYFPERGSRLVTLRHMSPMEAELARTRLQGEGIPCFLIDREMGAYWPLGGGMIPVKLQVHENDAALAEEILSRPAPESDDGEYVDEDWRCPKCHRKTVALVPMGAGRKRIRNIVLILLALPVAVGLVEWGIPDREFIRAVEEVVQWGFLPWMVIVAVLVLSLLFRRREKRCTECGHQWSDQPSESR